MPNGAQRLRAEEKALYGSKACCDPGIVDVERKEIEGVGFARPAARWDGPDAFSKRIVLATTMSQNEALRA